MDQIISYFEQALSFVGPFILLLGLLVFVHELGHFLVAKWCGVKVEVFSLGFGKKLLKYKHGDTTYCVSMIPLGGYVKMFGESLYAEVSDEERDKSFIHKPVGQRIAVVLAGPLMNLFFAFFLFFVIGFIGDQQPAAVVGEISPESQAYEVGFRPEDKVLEVNGASIQSWPQLTEAISASTGENLEFRVERGDEIVTLQATPQSGENENIFSRKSKVGQIEGLTFETRAPLVGVSSDSVAYKAGLRSLDLITKVNGKDVTSYRDLEEIVSNADGELQVTARNYKNRQPGEIRELTLPAGKNLGELGIEFAQNYILQVQKDTPAMRAGLKAGDKLVSIKGQPVESWQDILSSIKNFDPSKNDHVSLAVLRDGKELNFQITPEMNQLMTQTGQEENRYTIGIISSDMKSGPQTVLYRPAGVLNKFTYGLEQTWMWTEFTVMSVVRLFQGAVSPKNIGGVITIGVVASHSFEAGVSVFLKTMAIISINLFLLNLLPIPVLDGGHLVFFGLEAIKGSPVSLRKLEIAQQVGLMLLLLLMAFALFNDVSNFFFRRW